MYCFCYWLCGVLTSWALDKNLKLVLKWTLSLCVTNKQTWGENKQRLFANPRLSEMLYVSAASWQSWVHSSAPVSVLQGELSAAPAPGPLPRRLDFFLVSSPTGLGVKWGTNRQHRKWLTAAERLDTSTPCKDITGGCGSFLCEDPHLQSNLRYANMLCAEYCQVPGGNCWTLSLLSGWKCPLWPPSV